MLFKGFPSLKLLFSKRKHYISCAPLNLKAKILRSSATSNDTKYDNSKGNLIRDNSVRRTIKGIHKQLSNISGGWPNGVLAIALLASVVFTGNVSFTLWAIIRCGFKEGVGTVFDGDCGKVGAWSTWLHVMINILSSALLGGSNYCMQRLTAPTRGDIDRAHAQGKWLEIGIPSVWNLSAISTWKRALWFLFAVTSIPLHLMYNSAIFETVAAYDITALTVSNDFLHDGTTQLFYDNAIQTRVNTIRQKLLNNSIHFENISNEECIQRYSSAFPTATGDVLGVIMVSPDENFTVYSFTSFQPDGIEDPYPWSLETFKDDIYWSPPAVMSGYSAGHLWVCGDEIAESASEDQIPIDDGHGCNIKKLMRNATNWSSDGYQIAYCLSEQVTGRCQLQFSVPILSAVIICNGVKAACAIYMLLRLQDKPLVTLGDAISSFLEHQDPTTNGCGPLSKTDFSIGKRWVSRSVGLPETWWAAREGHHWARAGSSLRWCICLTLCLITLIIASILLPFMVQASTSWNIGFGTIRSDNLLFPNFVHGLVPAILLANSPQALISFIYLFYNSLLTSMVSEVEWVSFSTTRQTLRVSEPKGPQRSTYWLQLPYVYGISLMITICTLHYGVSQSLFLSSVIIINDSDLAPIWTIRGCGYSGNAIIFSICLGVLLVATLIILAFRRYSPGIPLVGSCSAAISAACHPPPEDTNAAFLPLMWGAVKRDVAIMNTPQMSLEDIKSRIDVPEHVISTNGESDIGEEHDRFLEDNDRIIPSTSIDSKLEKAGMIADNFHQTRTYCLTSMEVDPPTFDSNPMNDQAIYGFWV